jgi:hypothetical protein
MVKYQSFYELPLLKKEILKGHFACVPPKALPKNICFMASFTKKLGAICNKILYKKLAIRLLLREVYLQTPSTTANI